MIIETVLLLPVQELYISGPLPPMPLEEEDIIHIWTKGYTRIFISSESALDAEATVQKLRSTIDYRDLVMEIIGVEEVVAGYGALQRALIDRFD